MSTLYDYIYDFISYYFFNSTNASNPLNFITYEVSGRDLPLWAWLTTTCTIVIMIIGVILCCLLVRWVWKLVTSAFLLK